MAGQTAAKREPAKFDVVLRGGRVIDPASGLDGVADVAIRDGNIAAVQPAIAKRDARKSVDVTGRIVTPGLIDTHAHVYQYVTGSFGMNPDLVGIRSGVTTVIDQGGAAPLTIQGFRKFIVEPAVTRVYAFISNYLVGGLVGHRYTELYGPHGGLEGQIGTLAPGTIADVTVLARDVGDWTLQDSLGAQIRATERLRPEFAMKAGTIHQSDSPLLFESTKHAA